MACKPICKMCDRLVISTAVTFIENVGLAITIPAGTYANGEKYCILVAQDVPVETTISAPVYVRIGTGTTNYPLVDACCGTVTACAINGRTKYSTRVVTNATGGSFKLLGKPCCNRDYSRVSIP